MGGRRVLSIHRNSLHAYLAGVANANMKNLPFLDSLRGIAALYVVMFHMTFLPQPNLETPGWASAFVHFGETGVTLFFVVSAFSLCYTMPSHLRSSSPLWSFYTRRFFRIAPLFYVWIVISLVRDKVLYSTDHSLSEILASVFFVFNLIPGLGKGFIWASWTIGVEMMFYLIFPFLCRFIHDVSKAFSSLLFALLLWISLEGLIVYLPLELPLQQSLAKWSVLRHMPMFLAGMTVYICFETYVKRGNLSSGFGMALMACAAFGYAAMLNGWLNSMVFSNYYWQGIVYGTLLMGLAAYPSRIIVNRITRFFGEISYSIYLNHPTIVVLLVPVYRKIYALTLPTTARFLTTLLITFVTVTAVSYITYHLIERPGIRFGRRLFGVKRDLAHA